MLFAPIFFNANHISQHFSIRFFSSCDFCNKYHILGKNNSSNDQVTVCRSKKEVSLIYNKHNMLLLYNSEIVSWHLGQTPPLLTPWWHFGSDLPPPPGVSWYMDDPIYISTSSSLANAQFDAWTEKSLPFMFLFLVLNFFVFNHFHDIKAISL